MLRFRFVVAALILAGNASPLLAQVQLVPSKVPKWDASVQVGWTSGAEQSIDRQEFPYDRRYDAGTISGSLTTLLSSHIRVGFGADYSGEGRLYSNSLVAVPGLSSPQYVFREHRFQDTSVNAFIGYQFFENRWVHPSVALGVQAVRDVHHITSDGLPSPRGGITPAAPLVERSVRIQPFADVGVKFYVAERAFIRTSAQVSLSPRLPRITWTTGAGFDF